MRAFNIKTVYYRGKSAVKTTRSKWANSASKNAFGHMQTNQYDATHCEVFDESTGELHAVITAKLKGGKHMIETIFEREVREGM